MLWRFLVKVFSAETEVEKMPDIALTRPADAEIGNIKSTDATKTRCQVEAKWEHIFFHISLRNRGYLERGRNGLGKIRLGLMVIQDFSVKWPS